MLLVDDDDRDDEEAGQVEAVQHQQEPLADEPPGDQLLEKQCRAHSDVTIWVGRRHSLLPPTQDSNLALFKLANEEVGGGELPGAVDDVEEQSPDPEHGVDAPPVPTEENL